MEQNEGDIERLIEKLKMFQVNEIGSNEWFLQHLVIQKLNSQAHNAVLNHGNNFVLDHLVTHDKLKILIHELVAIEAWRENLLKDNAVFTNLANHSIKAYHILYHEAVTCNLMEIILYHDYAALACGDQMLDLVDYCVRRVIWLTSSQAENTKLLASTPGLEDSDEESFRQRSLAVLWRCSVASISILRFVSEHIKQFPVGIMTRLIDTHDVPCLMVPLIENPPWTRRTPGKGIWEKYKDHEWVVVEPQDLLLLTPLEAQPWLILFNLLCEGEFRKQYRFHSFRKDTLLRIRRYLNMVLVDQLSVLSDLQRVLDEMTIVDAPPATSFPAFVVEQVAEIREQIQRSTKWDAVKQNLVEIYLGDNTAKDDPIVLALAGIYGEDEPRMSSPPSKKQPTTDPNTPENVSISSKSPSSRAPSQVVLLLPTPHGTSKLNFISGANSQGTQQQTSKGEFIRFQLQMNPADTTPEQSITLQQLSLSEIIISMNDEANHRLCANPLRNQSQSSNADMWQTYGSLKSGVIGQLQCIKGDNEMIQLGVIFVSIQA